MSKKKKLLLASVLKPVNDARMYEKFAISLSRIPEVEVHVAGFYQEAAYDSEIFLHPLFKFSRLSPKRALAPFYFLRLLLKIKPQVVILTTFELLLVTIFYKIFSGCKIIYDVQENYYRNIRFTNAFPPVIREILAVKVRLIEYISRPFVSHFILAERNYEQEFSFTKGKRTIIENKARKPPIASAPRMIPGEIKMIYTGTISESYGVREAIKLAADLHQFDSSVTLNIIGYSSDDKFIKELKNLIKPHPFIELSGGDRLIPHQQILEAISKADIGLVSYRSNKSTENCIPTKIYEYLAWKLPMIIPKNPLWEGVCSPYKAAVSVDYFNYNSKELLARLRSADFYSIPPSPEIFWESEEDKLKIIVNKYL